MIPLKKIRWKIEYRWEILYHQSGQLSLDLTTTVRKFPNPKFNFNLLFALIVLFNVIFLLHLDVNLAVLDFAKTLMTIVIARSFN